MKTLLINSDGIVGANPEMERPLETKKEPHDLYNPYAKHIEQLDNLADTLHGKLLKAFWQGFVPFEDQEKIKQMIFWKGIQKLTPNSIIEADIEYEVAHTMCGNEYKKVLRLKD